MEMEMEQSMLGFFIRALGAKYIVYFAFWSLVSFAMTLLAVVRWRNPASAILIFLCVPLPMVLGWLSFIDGMVSSFQVIATSPTAPKPSELSEGFSMSLVGGLVGIWLSIPNFLLALVGCTVRLFMRESIAAKVIPSQPQIFPQPSPSQPMNSQPFVGQPAPQQPAAQQPAPRQAAPQAGTSPPPRVAAPAAARPAAPRPPQQPPSAPPK